jgi:hypothetical protein
MEIVNRVLAEAIAAAAAAAEEVAAAEARNHFSSDLF